MVVVERSSVPFRSTLRVQKEATVPVTVTQTVSLAHSTDATGPRASSGHTPFPRLVGGLRCESAGMEEEAEEEHKAAVQEEREDHANGRT